jgi:hypothetical protein
MHVFAASTLLLHFYSRKHARLTDLHMRTQPENGKPTTEYHKSIFQILCQKQAK